MSSRFLWMLTVAVGTAMVACQQSAPAPPAASLGEILQRSTFIDLTHVFDEKTVYWPTADGFQLTVDAHGFTEGGYYYEANSFAAAEHGGTHLDAPIHFAEGRWTTDQIPAERLIGPAVRIDVSARCLADPDYEVQVADLEAWEQANGPIADGTIVLLHTGFGRFWPDRARYLGTDKKGEEAIAELHFPGLAPAAARWLVENRSIAALGLDTASIDFGQSEAYQTHQILFAANIPAFENVGALDRLPDKGFAVAALPMKIGKGSGGPLRIVAMIPPSGGVEP